MVNVAGWKYYEFDKVQSTNDVIKQYCTEEGRRIAILAHEQTNGRGRCGRVWDSLSGNLFCSLALEFDLTKIGQLVAITALSLSEVLEKELRAKIFLKWPNDVLIDDAKISGILLEKGPLDYVIIGLGVNVKKCPENPDILYPTTSLAKQGCHIRAPELLDKYVERFSHNLAKLNEEGFADLRVEWLKRAKNLGKLITIRQNKKMEEGIFIGIDENACLLLETSAGLSKKLAGDVFLIER